MNICYSAGPGSGKTKTLVEEFGKAIEKADIGSVVAVTFTDKAANEMVERIAKKEKSRFMEFITSNRIGTIHSFCLSILKGYMPVTDVIDDKLSSVLKEKAVDIYLSESIDELLLDNFDFDDLKKSLRASLVNRFDKRDYIMDEKGYIAINDKTLLDLTAESIGAIRDLDNGELSNFIDRNKLLNYESLSLGEKLSVIEKIAGADCNKIKGLAGAKKELEDIMNRTMLTSENYESLLSYERAVLMALLKAFERVNNIYEEIKEGRLDFDDILIKTYRLLKDSPKSVGIEYLFVDEFQDVDPLQYRIMELLQQRNREMSTYVFGDPKQSIYSFRGADVEIFNMVSKQYEQRHLDRNYRSTPDLIRFFNEVTKPVFSENAEGYLTPYQKLTAERDVFPSTIGFDITKRGEEDREAEVIAERIEAIVGVLDILDVSTIKKADYGDIAILVDDTTHLSDLTRALTRHRIPYQISSGSGFFEAPEIKTLMNLLSVLEDPEDDIALFGLLRSELFHMSDAEIYEISLRGGKSLYERLPSGIRKEIEGWCSLIDILPPSELVSSIVGEKSYRGILALGERGKVAIRNVSRFIDLLRSFESSGVRSMHTVSDMILRFTDMRAKEPESSMPESNCVSIMTIHKAKGLEWPVVIVPYIYKRYKHNNDDLILNEKGIGIKTNLRELGPERRESLMLIRLKREMSKREEEERKRVLYVAMTRAKDHLFFTGCLPQRVGKCWATEIFDKSLNLTQTAKSTMDSKLHYVIEFDDNRMWLRRASIAKGTGEKQRSKETIDVRFIEYKPREEKFLLDPSYASFLLECPMKYHLAKNLGNLLSAPELSRKADGRFYGSVIHRALELKFSHPRKIVEEVALSEGVELNEDVIEEGIKRIERAESVLKSSELKGEGMEEVSFLKDMGDFCIKGRADLLISDTVVDYKTDADIATRIKEYEMQLCLYSIALGTEKACIYSVKDGKLLPVTLNKEALLRDIRKRIKDPKERISGEHCEECSYRGICKDPSVKI